MGRDISEYVATCSVCNKNIKTRKYGHGGLKHYQAGAPMERVHIYISWAITENAARQLTHTNDG